MNAMVSRSAALFALGAVLVCAPAHAQTINADESAEPYGTARGWSVYSMADGRGIFACRAVRGQGYDDQFMLEYNGFDESWMVYLRGTRPAGGGVGIKGAVVYFDGRAFDRQIGFGIEGEDGSSDSHARLYVEAPDLALVQSGSTMRIDINGEGSRAFSLSGTAAAILKVSECAGSFGFAPAGMSAAAAPAPQPAPQPVQPPAGGAVDGNSVGYVVHAAGQFRRTGGANWVEEGNNGAVFYFEEYDRNHESVFLNDASRNMQLWISLPSSQISFTQNFNNNGWTSLYNIDCYDREASRNC